VTITVSANPTPPSDGTDGGDADSGTDGGP
ncbi:MAG: hypothetical protein QOJ72_2823, partial [Nocardioidaceae bacterium]|nr:hypothetical protein [Nocardioidaceae bacterium]